MVNGTVTINVSGLKRFASVISERSSHPAVVACLKQWAARYRGFVQARFDRYSKGGGDWKPLSSRTIAGRRKGKGKGGIAILRDKGLLFAALNPELNTSGGFEKIEGFAITVGYGGPAKHTGKGSRISIADLAAIHDKGLGVVPQRQIIVEPDDQTRRGMAADAARMLKRIEDVD